ncbi:MAG: GNAT family N-acetyltransferase [Bacteroidota bacterium]
MIKIRLASKFDVPVISKFQIEMAKETENYDLDKDTVDKGVISVFRDPQKGKYYIATDEDKIIASLLITHEWSDWRNSWVYWIQSVYVITEKRGQGVFKMMYNHILEYVKNNNEVAGLRLYVDIKNTAARNVYGKIGMNGDHYQVFEWMK